MKPEKKLNYLRLYINDRIDKWPSRFPPFEKWLTIYLIKKEKEGIKNSEQRQKDHCAYCERSFHQAVKTKDHVVARSIGGYDRKQNRLLACEECNLWKADKSIFEWLEEIKKLVKRKKTYGIYTIQQLGIMIGNIKKIIAVIKTNEKNISTYKIRRK